MMQKWLNSGFSWKYAILLCVIVSIGYYFLVLERARVDLKIVTKARCDFKIYWAEPGQDYSERRVAQIRLGRGREQYNFSMRSLKNLERLRIDTHDFEGTVALKHLEISQPGHRPVRLYHKNAIKRLQPVHDIQSFTSIEGGFRVESSGTDPSLELVLYQAETQATHRADELYRLAILCLIVLCIYAALGKFAREYSYVPICMLMVLVMVAIMAVTTKRNVHPDEYVHVAAVNYYKSNWFPPQILDENIKDTYSPYGISRLNGDEVYYFIAGKFAFAFERMFENPYTAARMCNVLLFFVLCVYLINVQQARVMALPFLISPQIWYLFCYCNSEAFALTIIFLASCQVVLPDSSLRRYFESHRMPGWALHGVTAGLILACLPLLKKNFVIYTGFFALVALVSFYRLINETELGERKFLYRKLVALVLVVVSLYGGKKFVDYQINGPNKSGLVSEAIAAYAKPYLRADTSPENRMPNMMMRDRGVSLKNVIVDMRWFERSFMSSFGLYGYFNTPASAFVYNVFRFSALILAIYFFATIFVRGSTINKRYAIAALAMSGLLICISINHSWNNDFQPQGRYLFPIVGILCILCGQNMKIFSERWLSLLVVWMFCLSSYSYISVAFLWLPRNYLL